MFGDVGRFNELQRMREETKYQTIAQYEKKRERIDELLDTIHDENEDIIHRKNALQRLVNEFGDPDRISHEAWSQLNQYIKLIRVCEEDIEERKAIGKLYLTEEEIKQRLLHQYQEVSDAIENACNYGQSLKSVPLDTSSLPMGASNQSGHIVTGANANNVQIPANSVIAPKGTFDESDGTEDDEA